MPPIAIAAGIGAAGSIAGGLIGKSGAESAADTAAKASKEANQLQKQIFDTQRKDLGPWTGTGAAALGRLSYLLGLNAPVAGNTQGSYNANYNAMGATPAGPQVSSGTTRPRLGRPGLQVAPSSNYNDLNVGMGSTTDPQFRENARVGILQGGGQGGSLSDLAGQTGQTGQTATPAPNDGQFGSLMHDFSNADFEKDPGYEFRLAEGAKALERSAAAKGVLGSGGFLKDLTQYNQGFASNEFGNAFDRFQTNRGFRYNSLANLAGLGQVGVGQLGQAGQNYANQASNNIINAAGIGASARASAYGNIGNSISSGANNLAALYYYNQQGRE